MFIIHYRSVFYYYKFLYRINILKWFLFIQTITEIDLVLIFDLFIDSSFAINFKSFLINIWKSFLFCEHFRNAYFMLQVFSTWTWEIYVKYCKLQKILKNVSKDDEVCKTGTPFKATSSNTATSAVASCSIF